MSRRGAWSSRTPSRPGRSVAALLAPALAVLGLAVPVAAASPAQAAPGAPGSITLTVKAARDASPDPSTADKPVVKKGDPITTYKWLITADDIGNVKDPYTKCAPYSATGASQLGTYSPGVGSYGVYNPETGQYEDAAGNAFDPSASCQWPSTRYTPGAVAVIASGDQSTIGSTAGKIPPGKYLISVTADGFKIDGAHFTVTSGGTTPVTVQMIPYPTPLGTVRYTIFEDVVPVDGTYEADAEPGLGGFVGHISDVMGEVTTDFYGNRLCTNYKHERTLPSTDPNYTAPGDVPLAGYSRSNYDPTSPLLFDADGVPQIDTADPGGTCYSDRNGDIVMPHLGPDRYAASAVGPQGQEWFQTNTLEGSHDWDIWMAEGATGFDTEFTVGAEKVTNDQIGFVPAGYNLNASGARTGPKTIAVTARTVAGTGANRTVTLTLAASATTIRASQQIVLTGLGFGLGGLNGAQIVTAATGNTVTFRAPGFGIVPNPGANTRITTPDAGPALYNQSAGHAITGTAVQLNTYVAGTGGVPGGGDLPAGASVKGPVKRPIVTLSNLANNDQMEYVARASTDGTISIPHVPDGTYQLTVWDYDQDLIIDSFNVTVAGADVNLGQKGLVGWWTEITGSVFIDANANGVRDPGESGVPQFLVAFKERDNSTWDQGINGVTTDTNGDYVIREAYPVTKWSILEAFNTRYTTTGITVQADNAKTPTTYLGAAVDLNVLPIIGLSGRVDWGVQPYTNGENGGIAGTVTYDTTRNELSPADAATEPYQPGIPNMSVHLYYPLRDPNTGDLLTNADGSVKLLLGTDGQPLDLQDPYISETWEAPKGCDPLQWDGSQLLSGRDQYALPPNGDKRYQCVEAPMGGWTAIPSDETPGNFGQTVNGNYAFADMNYDADAVLAEAESQAAGGAPGQLTKLADPVALPNGDDFVVKVDSPKDVLGNDIYKPTREEDVNVFDGDVRMPQENYPLSADDVQPGATVDPTPGQGGPVSQSNGIVSECAGANHTVHVTSQGFIDVGGSPFEGQDKPLCDAKVITIRAQQTVAPNFNYFTDVPLPTHFWGLTINDLGLSHDKTQIGYGEAQPMPNVPMGVYDYTGRLVDTVITDYNGMYETTEPSTSSYNCPLPAGPCPGMYYFKGNDPGTPGHPNPEYNPRFRTIGTNFQAWPGLYTVTDTAPTQVAQIALSPGSTQIGDVQCDVSATTPNLMSVSTPYMLANTPTTTPVAAQNSLTVTNIRIQGGGPNGGRTVRLTIPALAAPGTPPTVSLPTLTTANAGSLSAAQRTAINAVANPKTVSNTGTTAGVRWVEFTMAGGLTLNTGLTGVTVTVTGASTPAYSAATTAPNTTQTVTVRGTGFGTAPAVTLTNAAGTQLTQAVAAGATDTQLTFTVSTGNNATTAPAAGVYQLGITNAGKQAVNGLSFHILGTGYTPTLVQVNQPATAPVQSTGANRIDPQPAGADLDVTPEHAIQRAVDRAAAISSGTSSALVVVWPGVVRDTAPAGDYFENLLVYSNVKIQGVGPGGFQGDTYVPGSRVNGMGFQPDNPQGTDWIAELQALNVDPTTVPDGAVVTYLNVATGVGNPFNRSYTAALDGLTVTGGAQQGLPANLNTATGGNVTPVGGDGALVTQGGGVYLHGQANNTVISNDVIVGNSGSYGGGIRIGSPYSDQQQGGNVLQSSGVRVLHNRLRDNGGTNLAGGVGIFDGSDNYVVDHNDLCGNFSAEYGGGISHYGQSNGGKIAFNRIYLNGSYDEGGGVMIAGELNPNLTQPSTGAATTSSSLVIDGNLVERNIANDDGGGIRFLSAGNVPITVTNNVVNNNLSTHEGGGFALDDSTNVRIIGNTVARNVTTATAITSDGRPAPAGLSTAANSSQLQGTLPSGSPTYSRPVLRSNIVSGNLAGSWNPATQKVEGIDPANGPRYWDIGTTDAVTVSIPVGFGFLQAGSPTTGLVLTSTSTADPGFTTTYDVSVIVETNRAYPSFRQSVLVASNVAPDQSGDYHLTATAAARGAGGPTGASGVFPAFPSVAMYPSTTATLHDIDGQPRPQTGTTVDAGADERS